MAGGVDVTPHDIALFVDAVGARGRRARNVDGKECALAQEKAMAARGAAITTDDIASGVDPIGERARRARNVDGKEYAVSQEKAMAARGVAITPDDIASRIDPIGAWGAVSSGNIDPGESLCPGGIAARRG